MHDYLSPASYTRSACSNPAMWQGVIIVVAGGHTELFPVEQQVMVWYPFPHTSPAELNWKLFPCTLVLALEITTRAQESFGSKLHNIVWSTYVSQTHCCFLPRQQAELNCLCPLQAACSSVPAPMTRLGCNQATAARSTYTHHWEVLPTSPAGLSRWHPSALQPGPQV